MGAALPFIASRLLRVRERMVDESGATGQVSHIGVDICAGTGVGGLRPDVASHRDQEHDNRGPSRGAPTQFPWLDQECATMG
jgi:hypothetical protein